MTFRRIAAALAACLTALLLQATLVAPLTVPVPVSLPAVVVAVIGLCAGPSAGLMVGFSTGLLADLGSEHPAGVLALCWLALGLGCGLIERAPRRALPAAALVGGATGVATGVGGLLLAVLGSYGTTASDALRWLVPSALGDVVIALLVVPLVRGMLRHDVLRAPVVGRGYTS